MTPRGPVGPTFRPVLFMSEYQTRARFRPHRRREGLGEPIKVVVTGGLMMAPRPPTFGKLHSGGSSVGGASSAVAGIFQLKKLGGHDPWLLLSWFPGGHNPFLSGIEIHGIPLRSERGEWDMHWVPVQVSCSAFWELRQGREQLKIIGFTLNSHWMDALFEYFGDPYVEGRVLAGQLMPRLCPAALRIHDDKHFHIWIRL